MLSPDLGADIVRVFHVNPVNNPLAAEEPLKVAAGAGQDTPHSTEAQRAVSKRHFCIL